MDAGFARDKIAETLFGQTRRRVLGLLYGRPDESFYLRQIERLTDAGLGPVQRELEALTGAGLLLRDEQGRQVYFRANRDSPVFHELRGLIEKTSGLANKVKSALQPLVEAGGIEWAFLYGSVATGRHSAASDVDLMLIGTAELTDVGPVLRSLRDELNREINPTVYPVAEFRRRLAARDHFLQRVLDGDRMMLAGSEDELESLVRESVAG